MLGPDLPVVTPSPHPLSVFNLTSNHTIRAFLLCPGLGPGGSSVIRNMSANLIPPAPRPRPTLNTRQNDHSSRLPMSRERSRSTWVFQPGAKKTTGQRGQGIDQAFFNPSDHLLCDSFKSPSRSATCSVELGGLDLPASTTIRGAMRVMFWTPQVDVAAWIPFLTPTSLGLQGWTTSATRSTPGPNRTRLLGFMDSWTHLEKPISSWAGIWLPF